MTNTIIKAIAILVVTGSLSFGSLYPPLEGDLAVSIPFAFQVNGKMMRAGEYIVRADPERGVLHVCEDGVYCASVEVTRLELDKANSDMQLVFTNHDGQYYLSLVRCDQGECYEIPLPHNVGRDGRVERVKARKLVIHQFPGLPTAWS